MICWFCDLIEEDPKKALHLNMYGEVDSKTVQAVTKVAYNVVKIDIARCPLCNAKHRFVMLTAILGAVGIVTVAVLSILTAFGVLTGIGTGLLIGLFLGLTLSIPVIRSTSLRGIKSVNNAKKKYPEVKELLIKSYRFGVKPKDQIKEGQSKETTKPVDSSTEVDPNTLSEDTPTPADAPPTDDTESIK